MMTNLVHDLLDLPEAVRKGDFVQGLADGIAKPEATLRDYAITPKILQSFRHALSMIKSALDDSRSQPAYLDGSFGSGKSHFMAVLALMLMDNPTPWRRPELHALRTPHPWIGAKKLVQLPIHMLDAQDMESKILGTYVRWVAEQHPDAAVPAVYVDEGLIEDARRLRARMGDDAFFADLNGGAQQAAAGWGKRATAANWEADTFEAAAASAYLGEEDRDAKSPRARLFSDLVRTFFRSWTTQRSRFVDLDTGLGVVSRHANGLGYDGVVLYLDELILWLAGRSGDLPFVGQEVQKLVKLKEAQDADRAIPIVSFIARQRDLSEFLGAEAHGAIRAQLSKNLSGHDGRFEHVTLADSNLPAIVKHRVVRPRNEAAAERLKDDFARTWRASGQAASVLIGSEGDEAAFRQVYPFSPALVEALVALSDCLQRERTAIRILMELLVHHLPDQELGRVVPVGDAFDALAESEDPIDDPVMKARFDRARDLYRNSFLHLIRRAHQTDAEVSCQRMRDDHDKRLGCSLCPQAACREDNRLAKTLLMAALVPEARPFKGLTVKRLVHLNHGAISSPIPGDELQEVAGRLHDWASKIGALRLGDQADPEVSVHLSGIDLQPILAAAAEADKPGARKNTMRRLLFDALGLAADGSIVDTDQSYFGTKRPGRVRYGNVREMDDGTLTAPADIEWQLVIDYPFDERLYVPADDLARVEAYRDSHGGGARPNPTVIWLPTFFSRELENELGDLVVLEHILDGDTSKYLGHLRVEDQTTTRADLTSLRAQKESLVKRTLAQAYGLTTATETTLLDPSRSVDEHIVPLLDDLEIRSVLAGNLKDGLRQIVDAVLSKRYPHHPRFDGPVNASRMERVHGLLERMLETRDRRMNVEKGERNDLKAYSDPLGLTDTGDVATVLRDRPLQELEQARQQRGLDTPTVGAVRSWLDVPGTRGLLPEVEDLLVLTWCAWSGRTLQRGGRSYTPVRLGQLPDDVELLRPVAGPPGTRWQPAVDLARRYAEEGGHVEWARQQLRGLRDGDETLLGAARSLEAATAAALRDDHRRFAEAYVSWVDAGKPSSAAIPIEDLGKQVIAPFLKGGPRRKLLVVLMDGMSQAAAVQVLTRLGTARRWGPIAWRKDGEHGGLSLAEAVSPAVLIAPDWLERAVSDDAGLAVRPLPTPDWWDLRTRKAAPRPAPRAAEPQVQPSLFAPPSAATPPPPAASQPLVEALRRSAVFQAQVQGLPGAEVERVLSWLGALAEAGGALPAEEFALAAGLRPHQVGGAVARMGVLNADGYAMVEYDHVSRRVLMQRSRLAQHYGIPQ